ncbi:Rossmann-like and DUF2520 domain-containing protein [Bergeyella cardium]|uniref:Rossmann-like and DUF2520 domain-containing protein n=1 Tax=Bergeyella cardium TaxID=1585976 RepID=UPI000EA14270|nr:DUF2520 domain-containing protein [Bergeyella cardium]
MKIVILGSGNVAYHLAKALKQSSADIIQIFGRNAECLAQISSELGIPTSTTTLADADLYIISVSDSSVTEVSKLPKNPNALVVHTAGSLPLESLQGNYRKGVFYPLQTFSKSRALDYSQIPFFIEAEHKSDEEILKSLALKISDKAAVADYQKRKYIHLTAVFACNFTNHLFTKAKEISDSQSIPFSYFLPLIDETVQKIHILEPKQAQTGPAIRNDIPTLSLQKQLLASLPSHLLLYETLSQSILVMNNK